MIEAHVSTRELCTLTGITYRQADYWVRQGYLLASGGGGSGIKRFHDLSEVRVAAGLAQLLRAGCWSAEQAAVSIRSLPPEENGTILLDSDGFLTDDLDVARWVVQLTDALTPA